MNLETLSFCGYFKCSIYTVHLCCFPLLLCLFVHILCFPLYSCITFLFSATFILSPLGKFSNSDFFCYYLCKCHSLDVLMWPGDSFCDHFVSLSTWQSYACCFPYIYVSSWLWKINWTLAADTTSPPYPWACALHVLLGILSWEWQFTFAGLATVNCKGVDMVGNES